MRTIQDGDLQLHVAAAARHGFDGASGTGSPHAGGSPHGGGMGGLSSAGGTPASIAAPSWTFDVPDGWVAKPATKFRLASFSASGGAIDVSLSVLPGAAGGVVDNVNRWRGQLGLEPIDAPAVDALPRKEMASANGRTAYVVDLRGRFQAQGRTVEDARMLGIVAPGANPAEPTLFVKLTGDAEAMATQEQAFAEFVDSLAPASPVDPSSTGPMPSAAPPGSAAALEDAGSRPLVVVPPAEGTSGGKGPLRWTLPRGWVPGASKSSMRVATFNPAGDTDLDCYIVVLAGAAGGLKANLDRWRGQVGLPQMTQGEIAALPRISMLGQSSVVLEAIGDAQGILGVVAPFQGRSLFVKMTGPSAKVRAARDGFLSFCQSIEDATTVGGAQGKEGGR